MVIGFHSRGVHCRHLKKRQIQSLCGCSAHMAIPHRTVEICNNSDFLPAVRRPPLPNGNFPAAARLCFQSAYTPQVGRRAAAGQVLGGEAWRGRPLSRGAPLQGLSLSLKGLLHHRAGQKSGALKLSQFPVRRSYASPEWEFPCCRLIAHPVRICATVRKAGGSGKSSRRGGLEGAASFKRCPLQGLPLHPPRSCPSPSRKIFRKRAEILENSPTNGQLYDII